MELEAYNHKMEQIADMLSAQGDLEFVPLHRLEPAPFKAMMLDSDHDWVRGLGWKPEETSFEDPAWIAKHLNDWYYTKSNSADVTVAQFQIRRKGSAELLGETQVCLYEKLKKATIGYYVLPSCRNQGLATKMVQQVVEGFTAHGHEFGVRQIVAGAEPENTISLRILETAGFERRPDMVNDMRPEKELVMLEYPVVQQINPEQRINRDAVGVGR